MLPWNSTAGLLRPLDTRDKQAGIYFFLKGCLLPHLPISLHGRTVQNYSVIFSEFMHSVLMYNRVPCRLERLWLHVATGSTTCQTSRLKWSYWVSTSDQDNGLVNLWRGTFLLSSCWFSWVKLCVPNCVYFFLNKDLFQLCGIFVWIIMWSVNRRVRASVWKKNL